MAEAADIKSWQ